MSRHRFDLDRYLNVRSAIAPSFSPDGRHVAFLSDSSGVYQVWDVARGGSTPVQLTCTAETVRGAWYSPRAMELIFAMDAAGNERTQLYRLRGIGEEGTCGPIDGWDWTALTQGIDAIHEFGGWSHDGRRIAFAANRIKEHRFDLYLQDLEDEARLIREGPGGYYTPQGWSPDDRLMLVSRDESSSNSDLYLVDSETSEAKHLTPHPGEASYQSPQWAADAASIYCLSTYDRDMASVAQIEINSGRLRYLETPDREVEALWASPHGRWLVWVVNAEGRSELQAQALRLGTRLTPPELPLGVITHGEFTRQDTEFVFALNGPRHNSDLWIWDLATNRLRQLTHSSRAGIPFSSFSEPELVHYKTFDGRMIPAWFYAPRPTGTEHPRTIVHVHGGPAGQARPLFNPIFQYFIQEGYGILAPNVRGSRGYGITYMDLDNVTRRMDAVQDLRCAVHWLRDERKVDPARIAVFGGSYGGFMVLAAVTHYPQLFAAGVEICGVSNWVTFMEHTGAYRRAHREAEYGNLREHRAFLESISPIHHVEKIRCPMMVIHGANDPRVPVGEAEQIVTALRARAIPVDYLRYEDEGHGLFKLRNRLDAYPKIVAFLDRHLA